MKKPNPQQARLRSETLLEMLSSNAGLIVVVLFIFAFIFQNFAIPSSSMASTLLVGDHILVERQLWRRGQSIDDADL